MLRKTLITLMAVAALGAGSTAMAMHGGGGGGGHGGGGGGGGYGGGGHGGGYSGGGGGPGLAATRGGTTGPMMMHGTGGMGPMMQGSKMVTAPMTSGQGWSRNAWGMNNHVHDHFHHRFHNRKFFAFGFGGPIYDYAYSSCWSWVPTRYGWQRVYVCGDYYGY